MKVQGYGGSSIHTTQWAPPLSACLLTQKDDQDVHQITQINLILYFNLKSFKSFFSTYLIFN